MAGNLFVISGPSGVGKGTVILKVLEDKPKIWKSVSATTRAPREGEVDGVDYFFMSKDDFEHDVENGDFLEHAQYSGNYYGTPRKFVDQHLENGEDVILEIEVQGALQVKASKPDAILIFIEPPSMEVLEERLRGRGSEDEATIQRRLEAAKLELASKKEYNCTFVNDDLPTIVRELEECIENQ